ncbi:UDP-glucuronosyl and UDP-glucosyl transferase [Handroanthus impetiginosus]|uniref:Glycosyltransferase n=1 Tax=Handroanthus impetiginosus TaxID=429701 RepID=A0A2G9GFB8_9LAMI|nr:UDP-glucuronosyl and UDP-glucosyl transferase [Handroanthus impetiginosus]
MKKDSSYDDVFIKLVELHVPSLVELPPHFHTTKNLPSDLLPTLLKAFQMSSSSFSDILSSINPDLLIYDMFQPWAPKIASSKGIPSVYFATSGAAPFSFYHHVYTMGDGSTFPYPAIYLLDHERINFRDRLIPYLKDADDDFAFGNLTKSCEIVLMKSCREVEEKYIDYLSVLCKKRVVTTGPLIVDSNDYDHEEFSKIMKWLSGKSRHSTVYISFGSEYFLSKEQIVEIAKALELCEANFIWVVRFPGDEKMTSVENAFLIEFLERVKERGLIVPRWAPQTKILAHPSVGGFVSHCGWSSITEGMYFGVPIIGMPMKSEQPINARLVVEVGAGVEVGREGNGLYVRERIVKVINKVIAEKEFCEDTRNRAKKLSEKIKEKEEQEVNEVAMELLKICMKNKQQV